MTKGTKIMIGIGVLAIAGVVFYFVNKKFNWVNLGGSVESEDKASASGIQCMCKDKWGRTRPQSCRGTKYKTCEDCCSHYGRDNVNEQYGW
jgi:hypothetical protein